MALGFTPSTKRGQHYDLVKFTASKLKSANLSIKGRDERDFEHAIVSHLQSSPKIKSNLITQVGTNEVDKIVKANMFSFSHRPDISIGNDGTAIEIKVIKSGSSIRDLLGQAVVYRMHYRFVILVMVDLTQDCRVVELCKDKKSQEFSLLSGLAEQMNVYTIIGGPNNDPKNQLFISKS